METAIVREEARCGGTIRELHELVAALDRRVPRVERAGEASIARSAAALREAAARRIEELEHAKGESAGVDRMPPDSEPDAP